MSVSLSGAKWRKSRHSGPEQECVEVADNPSDVVGVRDSKDREGPGLAFTRREWNAFVAALKTSKLG